MRAFKFLNNRFLDSFRREGILRIGTASDFRIPDGRGAGRSDEVELAFDLKGDGKLRRLGDVPALASSFMKSKGADSKRLADVNIRIEEGAYIRFQADAYMFCVSKEVNARMIRFMKEKFDCDRCVEISDFEEFSRRVTLGDDRLLFSGLGGIPAGTHLVGQVRYENRSAYNPSGEVDPLSKRRSFEWQRELRVVWPHPAPTGPFVMQVPSITSLLRVKI